MPSISQFTQLPYTTLSKLNCPWLSSMIQQVTSKIEELKNLMINEAEFDGQPELADEAYLFEQFKDNCNNQLWNGNWQILKYFVTLMEIKVFELMLGKCQFTDADKEMYNYFAGMKVNATNKCKPSALKYKSGAVPNTYIDPNGVQMLVYYTDETTTTKYKDCDIYTNFFHHYFELIEDMVRNVKMLTKRYPVDNFFEMQTPFKLLNDRGIRRGFFDLKDIGFSQTTEPAESTPVSTLETLLSNELDSVSNTNKILEKTIQNKNLAIAISSTIAFVSVLINILTIFYK